jgi:hypothetical protein
MKQYLGKDEVSASGITKEVRSSYLDEGYSILKKRYADEGYLCMRSLIPREDVMRGRRSIYDYMTDKSCLSKESSFENIRGKVCNLMGQREVTHTQDFLSCVENSACFDFFENIYGEKAISYDYKWARAVAQGTAGTGAHMDNVYMGKGSSRLMTMWIPIGDIPRENGPIAMLENSHQASSLDKVRTTYGNMDVDTDLIQGWFSENYREISEKTGLKWLVGDYRAGDVIVFGMHFLHGSFRNELEDLRLTCDVRFQPEKDPVDVRYMGDRPTTAKLWNEALKNNQIRDLAQLCSVERVEDLIEV